MFKTTLIQGMIPIYIIDIKIQWTDLPCTPLTTTLPFDLVTRGFVITCLFHRQTQGRGFILLKAFPVGMISVYVEHMLDIYFTKYTVIIDANQHLLVSVVG